MARTVFIFTICICLVGGAYGQKRYRHIPRVKINPEISLKKLPESLPDQLVFKTYSSNPVSNPVKENPLVLPVENKIPPLPPSIVPNQNSSHQEVIPRQRKNPSKKEVNKKMKILQHHHPLKTNMDSDELDLMGWISLIACITFIGGVLLNFFLGGFSTIVIVFIILSAVFAVATILFFVLSITIGE